MPAAGGSAGGAISHTCPVRLLSPRDPNLRLLLRLWLSACGVTLGLLFALDRLFPPPLAALERPPARAILARDGEPLRFLLPADERWRLPITLDEVPADFLAAFIAAEDRRFYRHSGVDPLAMARAAWTNLRAGRVVSGASTIPMQLARMAQPGPRTLGSKVKEALRAVQLSRRLSKRRQLELYLNVAPYGSNLEGIGAASWFYFGKRPAQLSLGEAALLVALPRSPNGFDPLRHPQAARRARDRVLGELAARGVFPRQSIDEARAQPLPAVRRAAPFAAPHASLLVAERYPGRTRLRTAIDRRLQAIAEHAVASRASELRWLGIGNAAAVVLEIDSRALRALVGSASFFEAAYSGQVNGATARRSPGSTLKPFLYALAFDQGRIVPDSYLLDVPTDFAGYVAENFDGTYRGRVTAREALVASLNAPAVRLLSDLGLPAFLGLLRRGGLATLDRPARHYGLPLVLGAGEVTLLDLANLYATLAEGGVHRPVRLLEPEPGDGPTAGREGAGAGAGERLFSRRAAELVARTLVDLARPDLPSSWDLARGTPAVAWKTGTSYGHRDAWAVGFSGRYAIGVWVGNFDGRPVTGIAGSEHAGPLLFDLFRALENEAGGGGSSPALLAPSPVEDTLPVCAVSHQLPGPHCPGRVRVPYLPGATRLASCSMHRRAFVDRRTGEILAGPCLAQRPHEARLLTLEPPELVAFWRAQGRPVAPLPRVAETCGGAPGTSPGAGAARAAPASDGPRIVSPDGATPYRLRREVPLEFQRIALIARSGPYARTLFWYEDGQLVASGAPGGRLFMDPRRGHHELVVVDDTGRSDTVSFRVD